jgi:DNA-binding FrmR family transcriptional regulator
MNTSQQNAELDRIAYWRGQLTSIANAMDEHEQSTYLSDHVDSIVDDLEAREQEILSHGAVVMITGGHK